MADEEQKDEATEAASIFPFKVEMQGYGTVTPPADTIEKENDDG
jgi:hypothetical protein